MSDRCRKYLQWQTEYLHSWCTLNVHGPNKKIIVSH